MKKYDLIIIGGGPGGYVAAIKAAQLNKKVALVESKHLGGICLNWGCIPTKSLLKNAEVLELVKDSKKYGIDITNYSVNWEKVIKRSRDIANRMGKGIQFLMKKNKVDVINGFGKILDKNTVEILKESSNEKIKTDFIIISTGASPNYFPGMEPDGQNIITYKDALVIDKVPKDIVIIGAGAIGIEFAYFFNTFGSEVTIVEAQSHILPNEDIEVSQWMHKVLKRKKIDIQTNTLATEINDEYVLVSIGVEGNSRGFGLNKIGIEIGPNQHIKVDKDGKTNINNIYAVGDVVGPPWLAHVSSTEGLYVVEHISKLNPKKIDYNCIPACTYSKPEIGSIGLSQEMLDKDGIDYKVVKSFFNANGKAVASSSTEGFIKILVSKDNYVLGAHIIGSNATEMISEFSLAMRNKLSVENILDSIHPHPTFSEAIFETLMQLK